MRRTTLFVFVIFALFSFSCKKKEGNNAEPQNNETKTNYLQYTVISDFIQDISVDTLNQVVIALKSANTLSSKYAINTQGGFLLKTLTDQTKLIKSVAVDESNNFYFGVADSTGPLSTFYKVDTAGQQIIHALTDNSYTVYDLETDLNNSVWIGAARVNNQTSNIFYEYIPSSNTFATHSLPSNNSGDQVQCIAVGKSSNNQFVWIGARTGTGSPSRNFFKYDKSNGQMFVFQIPDSYRGVLDITVDKNGFLWIATQRNNGDPSSVTYKFDPNINQFYEFHLNDNFANKCIASDRVKGHYLGTVYDSGAPSQHYFKHDE